MSEQNNTTGTQDPASEDMADATTNCPACQSDEIVAGITWSNCLACGQEFQSIPPPKGMADAEEGMESCVKCQRRFSRAIMSQKIQPGEESPSGGFYCPDCVLGNYGLGERIDDEVERIPIPKTIPLCREDCDGYLLIETCHSFIDRGTCPRYQLRQPEPECVHVKKPYAAVVLTIAMTKCDGISSEYMNISRIYIDTFETSVELDKYVEMVAESSDEHTTSRLIWWGMADEYFLQGVSF